MKKGKLTDQDLEALAKTVVTASVNAGDIEGAVSDPALYHKVLTRIAAECESQPKPSRSIWKPVAAFAAVIVLFSVSFVLYFSGRSEVPRATNRSTVPDTIEDLKPRPRSQQADEPEQQPAREPELVKTVIKRPVEVPQDVRPRRAKREAEKTAESVFHPIGLVEKAFDAAIDGRVVRVEMPRSALFALGVDLPLENGTRLIKADLLVGADGSPRAIRLVE